MDKTELIKNTYLFREIAANDLTALATIAEERDLMAGSLIYDAWQDSDAIFIIAMGTVDIVPQGKQAPFATMGSGQTFGELAFFGPTNEWLRPPSESARSLCGYLSISWRNWLQTDRLSASSSTETLAHFSPNMFEG
ncbi:cyclic nucleotide-binding domain-containing protein [Candidatus Methylomirabilis sp.]|uniref:cyclic nucleotide-binding domain-containing protein n=1 Tax=Candidatus Methylomirabilis sp. TaxID=2032687 RepID=UPI003076720B